MPSAPLRYCSVPGCSQKVTTGRCSAHTAPGVPSKGWRQYPEGDRIRGEKLQRLRAALFAQEPFCRLCMAAGRKVLAEVRDHIVGLAEGGAEDESNTQPLCRACNEAKRREESKRGIAHVR